MTVPNFLDKLTSKKEPVVKSFLALVLSDHRVQAAVWKVVAAQTEIISLGTPVEWDGDVATTNELVSAVDATISSATEGLGIDPDEIILGLANAWVDPNGIKQSKKDLIKSICRELSLKPIGYVVISDTIVKYLKMQEGAPPTSFLIQVDRRSVTLSLVELGSIKHTVSVKVSDNISQDVAEAIAHLPKDIALPSRFILVSAMENTSDLVQSLTAYDWQKSFSFLHTPKIEALPKDVEVHATAVAGGSEVAPSLGFTLDAPEEEVEPAPPTPVSLPPEPTAADLGFQPTPAEKLAPPKPSPTLEPSVQPDAIEVEDDPIQTPTKWSLPTLALPSLPKLNFPRFGSRLPLVILGLILLTCAGLLGAYYYIPQATVTITTTTKPITETIDLTLKTDATTLDTTASYVPAKTTTHEITGEESVPATGTKTIGDPARGEVTIYNRTTLPKTLLKGTTLTAGSLKFSLDSDVTVASKSAGADYVDVPGRANVKITATAFGASGNLPSGTEFSVASFTKDSYVAKNDSALSGGTSQEVTVVSATDQAGLLQSLKSKLSTELKDSLSTTATSPTNYYVIEEDIEVLSEEYSHKVGDPATTLTAELALSFNVLTYNQDDVQTLVQNKLDSAIPTGYRRTDLTPTVNLQNTTTLDNNDVQAVAEVTLYVAPILDETAIIQALKGRKYSSATNYLASIPGVVSSEIILKPNLPPRLLSLPRSPNRIQLLIDSTK